MPHALTAGDAAIATVLIADLWRTVTRNRERVTMPRRRGCILALALHGLRVAEITQARLDQLALPAATLYVRSVKRGRPRLIQLDPELASSLRTCNAAAPVPSAWLIPTRTGHQISPATTSRMVRKWLKENVGPYSAHSLRHAAAIRCYAATHDVLSVMHLLGHATLRHTLIYLATWQPAADPGPQWPPRYTRPELHVLGLNFIPPPDLRVDLRTAALTPHPRRTPTKQHAATP